MSSAVSGASEEPASGTESDATEAARTTGLTAGVAVLFLLLRLLAVSDWNWDTAAEVLETINLDDSISILFGTLFAVPVVAGILTAVLLPLAAVDVIRLWAESKWSLGKIVFVAVLAVAAGALTRTFGYWWLPLAILAVCIVIGLDEILRRRGRSRDFVLVAVRRVGTASVIAFLILAAIVRTPWTPEERIVAKSGDLTGYVLDTESGYLKVLESGDRKIRIVLTSNVVSRTPLP